MSNQATPASKSTEKPVFKPDAKDPISTLPAWTPEAMQALANTEDISLGIPGMTPEFLAQENIVLRWLPIADNDNAQKTSHLSATDRAMIAHCQAVEGAGGPVTRSTFPQIPGILFHPRNAPAEKQRIQDVDQELWWFRKPVHRKFIHGEADKFFESFANKAMDPDAVEYKKDKTLGTSPKGGMKGEDKTIDVSIR